MKRLPDDVLTALGHQSPKMVLEYQDDLQKIAAGLLADGLDVSKLTDVGRAELRQAIDVILNLPSIRASHHK